MYYQIKKEQVINCKIDELWEFVTSPKNLELITPKEMKFEVKSGNQDEKIYSGISMALRRALDPGREGLRASRT